MKPYTKKIRISFLAILALMLLSLALAACGEPTTTLQPAATTGTTAAATPTVTSVLPTPTTVPATVTPTNTPVIVPTATPLPTSTPEPTATPAPTNTPVPTATTAPTNTPVPATATPTATVKVYQPVVWFSAASLKVGDSLTVSGNGYPANTRLEIYLTPEGGAKDGPYATPTTDAQGTFKVTIKLDKTKQGVAFAPGKLSVQASTEGGALGAGAPVTLLAAVTPTTAPATKTPVATSSKEHWVDVNLSKQTMKFMEGNTVVRTNLITSGKKGYETPVGTFYINRRVYNETMVGGSPGAEDYYYLENVLYTQYFTNQGHALHYAWWRSQFGVPGSHGCVNEDLNTAKFAWDFLTIGSRVVIHY